MFGFKPSTASLRRIVFVLIVFFVSIRPVHGGWRVVWLWSESGEISRRAQVTWSVQNDRAALKIEGDFVAKVLFSRSENNIVILDASRKRFFEMPFSPFQVFLASQAFLWWDEFLAEGETADAGYRGAIEALQGFYRELRNRPPQRRKWKDQSLLKFSVPESSSIAWTVLEHFDGLLAADDRETQRFVREKVFDLVEPVLLRRGFSVGDVNRWRDSRCLPFQGVFQRPAGGSFSFQMLQLEEKKLSDSLFRVPQGWRRMGLLEVLQERN